MKRKINTTMLPIMLAILLAVGVGIFMYTKNSTDITSNGYLTGKKVNGSFLSKTNEKYTKDSMSFDFTGFKGNWTFFELNSTKGNKITIEDNSNVNKGNFYIVVLDSNYKNIAMKKGNEKKNIEFVTQEKGKFFIRIVGKEASGNFDIKITSKDGLKTSYIDFFE